jgi:Tfp pilus assembly protein PilZ
MKERRRSPRYEVVLKVRFETKKAFQDAIVHSLSSDGLYLVTEDPFDVGRKFRIEIDLPRMKEWIKGTCEVVWVNLIETKAYPKWIYEAQILKDVAPQQLNKGMGVKFVQLSPKYRKRVDEYLGGIGTS